jgi:hypothetical protein
MLSRTWQSIHPLARDHKILMASSIRPASWAALSENRFLLPERNLYGRRRAMRLGGNGEIWPVPGSCRRPETKDPGAGGRWVVRFSLRK